MLVTLITGDTSTALIEPAGKTTAGALMVIGGGAATATGRLTVAVPPGR